MARHRRRDLHDVENGAGATSVMKGFKGKMPDQDIWNVINYVRSLGPKKTLTRETDAVPVFALARDSRGVPRGQRWAVGCSIPGRRPVHPTSPPLPGQRDAACSRRRVRRWAPPFSDFSDRRPAALQPIEFPHNMHVGKKIMCETCHEGVATGPVAGLPSVKTCMICHDAIATDRPRIQQITAMRDKGLDLAWQRVYGYHDAVARAVQSRAAHSRQGRVLDLPRQHREQTRRAAQRRS